ncbi:hypothetical protein DBR24_27175 [Pseudomonas sp. HMWF006]|nr:hypothetical protein DBR24_27175 [Pseudomonas sp. HMWF006]PTT66336.1 hypothetical protein DBR26_17885 [Pseudomonas sp. HMWF007]PTT91101.1 hypothetical protein DBR29_12070 [Pseudomonas sp. HMWF005]
MGSGSGVSVAPESFRFFLLYPRPRDVPQILTDGTDPVGVSLLARAVDQSPTVLAGMPPSRAGLLLQGVRAG